MQVPAEPQWGIWGFEILMDALRWWRLFSVLSKDIRFMFFETVLVGDEGLEH